MSKEYYTFITTSLEEDNSLHYTTHVTTLDNVNEMLLDFLLSQHDERFEDWNKLEGYTLGEMNEYGEISLNVHGVNIFDEPETIECSLIPAKVFG